MTRAQDLLGRLDLVSRSIDAACRAAGRPSGCVQLVGVSKTWPTTDIEVLRRAGLLDFGENRAEELQRKAGELAAEPIRWHFLGQIQSKKAAAIGRSAHVVHSVDRAKVLSGLAHGAALADRRLEVFIQVSLADMAPTAEAAGRGGAEPHRVAELADEVAANPWLVLAGIMAMPPRSVSAAAAFARVAELAGVLQQRYPQATGISAGMSHDYPEAIAAGATHVRIGSALFGERNYVR